MSLSIPVDSLCCFLCLRFELKGGPQHRGSGFSYRGNIVSIYLMYLLLFGYNSFIIYMSSS